MPGTSRFQPVRRCPRWDVDRWIRCPRSASWSQRWTYRASSRRAISSSGRFAASSSRSTGFNLGVKGLAAEIVQAEPASSAFHSSARGRGPELPRLAADWLAGRDSHRFGTARDEPNLGNAARVDFAEHLGQGDDAEAIRIEDRVESASSKCSSPARRSATDARCLQTGDRLEESTIQALHAPPGCAGRLHPVVARLANASATWTSTQRSPASRKRTASRDPTPRRSTNSSQSFGAGGASAAAGRRRLSARERTQHPRFRRRERHRGMGVRFVGEIAGPRHDDGVFDRRPPGRPEASRFRQSRVPRTAPTISGNVSSG